MTMTIDPPLDLSDRRDRLRAEVRDFADRVVAPAAYEYDTKRERSEERRVGKECCR